MELTVLMPCLNEHETLAFCIGEAKSFLEKSGTAGEILVADNGSTDGSDKIALELDSKSSLFFPSVVNFAQRFSWFDLRLLNKVSSSLKYSTIMPIRFIVSRRSP